MLNLICAQHWRYENAQIFSFDYKYGAFVTGDAAGSEHYDLAGDQGTPSFCPLGILETPSDKAWAKGYIEMLCELQWKAGRVVTPAHRAAIGTAIEQMAQPGAGRTIDDFVTTVQDKEIREALAYYSDHGAAAELLNASSDSLKDHRWSIFEMMHLMERGESTVVPVLAYLFRCIERRLNGKRPTLVVLDEAWLSLRTPYFLERFGNWLRLLRSYNAAVIFATQNLTEILDSPIASLIISSTATKILLPNPDIMNPKIAPLYEAMGLTPTQMANLLRAKKKRDYYLISEQGRRMIQLGLGSVALAFLGASGKEDVDAVRAIKAVHGAAWPEHWMRRRLVRSDWIEYWRTLSGERRGTQPEEEDAIA